MFCLDCGTKISDSDEACPNCGLKRSEMLERLAQAQEMVAYAETIGPASTQKMPPVPERIYTDKDGNVFRPEEKIDVSKHVKARETLGELPQIGDDDPFLTMPIKKVVSDKGEVVADADKEQKVFLQNQIKQPFWTAPKILILIILIILVIVGCAWFFFH